MRCGSPWFTARMTVFSVKETIRIKEKNYTTKRTKEEKDKFWQSVDEDMIKEDPEFYAYLKQEMDKEEEEEEEDPRIIQKDKFDELWPQLEKAEQFYTKVNNGYWMREILLLKAQLMDR